MFHYLPRLLWSFADAFKHVCEINSITDNFFLHFKVIKSGLKRIQKRGLDKNSNMKILDEKDLELMNHRAFMKRINLNYFDICKELRNYLAVYSYAAGYKIKNQ